MELFFRPFSQDEESSLVSAIADVELRTSAEFKLHIDKFCKGDPFLKALNIFKHLQMDQTEDRNGVLIYVSVEDKKFAIIGDIGIHEKVMPEFWEVTRDKMVNAIHVNGLCAGILTGIHEAGNQLMTYFPSRNDDRNELNNDISYGS